jgi:hypothetical protein
MTRSIEERLDEMERQVKNLVEGYGAIADDTLRVCFILDEVARVGHLPKLPWDIATMLVELHHAMEAERAGLSESEGQSAKQRVEDIKRMVVELREEYQKSFSTEGP